MVSACETLLIGLNVSDHFWHPGFQGPCRSDNLLYVLYLSWHPILEGRDGAPGAKGVDMLGNNCSHYWPSDLVPTAGDRPKGEKGKGRKGKGWKLRTQDMQLVDLDIYIYMIL